MRGRADRGSSPAHAGVRRAGHARDDLAQQLEADVRVLLLRAGRHRVAISPARARFAAGMPSYTADQSVPGGSPISPDSCESSRRMVTVSIAPNGLPRVAQLGQVRHDRVVQVQRPLVAQLHDRRRGEGLGDRGDPVERPDVTGAARGDVGEAGAARPHELALMDDAGGQAGQPVSRTKAGAFASSSAEALSIGLATDQPYSERPRRAQETTSPGGHRPRDEEQRVLQAMARRRRDGVRDRPRRILDARRIAFAPGGRRARSPPRRSARAGPRARAPSPPSAPHGALAGRESPGGEGSCSVRAHSAILDHVRHDQRGRKEDQAEDEEPEEAMALASATRAGQNAIAIQMTSQIIHHRMPPRAPSSHLRVGVPEQTTYPFRTRQTSSGRDEAIAVTGSPSGRHAFRWWNASEAERIAA